MSRTYSDASEARPLGFLGISEVEERVYRLLLSRPGATPQDIADDLHFALRSTQRVLDTLEVKGLVGHAPERPRRYMPIPPDLAMKSMLLKRQQELRQVQAAVEQLQAEAAVIRDTDTQHMVELIASGDTERQIFQKLIRTSESEILGLIRSPLLVSNVSDPSDHDSQHQARARGVSFRSIADNEVLALPGVATAILADVQSGENVRVLPTLPFKMIIADRRTALVPLSHGRPGTRVLLVRESALLDALCSLFEVLWERAVPIAATGAGASEPEALTGVLPSECASLIPLLASGLTDKVISDELGVSTRTFDRRILKLLKTLHARTRFQAGWNAALRTLAPERSVPASKSGHRRSS